MPISPRCSDARATLAAPDLSPRSQGSLATPLECLHSSVRDPGVPSSWEVTFLSLLSALIPVLVVDGKELCHQLPQTQVK